MSKPNLKPCPFCGCEDIAISSGSVFVPDKHWYRCVCMECGAGSDSFGEKEAAIAAWNRRAQPDNPPLTLDELRTMGGEPVWIVEEPDWGHWELSVDGEDYLADRSAEFYGMEYNDPDGKYGLHKLGWLAYRRKLEGGNT